ncbi:MAG: DinB family protein [Planctomycetota bacterium]
MSSPIISGLLFSFAKNRDYGARLVHDLNESNMTAQPAADPDAPSNHPAWVLSHLNAYLPVIQAIIADAEFDDPKNHPFGMLSKPQTDPSIYASKDELLNEFLSRHDEIAGQLSSMSDDIFARPIRLPRWKDVMPTAGIALPYLMCNHENIHLGQVSAWRRIQGMPSV